MYSSWVKMLGSVRDRPLALKPPIQMTSVRWLLAWRPASLAAHRARLLTVVATMACLRVNEVARLQVCDLWFDYLVSYGLPGRVRCTSTGGRTTRCGKGTNPHSAARRIQRSTSWRSCGHGCGSLGWRYIGLAPSGPGRQLAVKYAPVISAHEVRAGRRHGVTVATDRPCRGSRQQASDWIR